MPKEYFAGAKRALMTFYRVGKVKMRDPMYAHQNNCAALFPARLAAFVYVSLTILASLCIAPGTACNNRDDPEVQAIAAVLEADKTLSSQIEGKITSGTPAKEAVMWYVSEIDELDLSACPTDFRLAYTEHVGAWRGMVIQLQSEPDSVIESIIYGFAKGLGGDLSGGVNESLQARKLHLSKIQATWTEVEVVAARYGAQ